MPTKKRAKAREVRSAKEITVDIPHGTKAAAVRQKIQAALRQVPTEILESGEAIIVRCDEWLKKR
jgi:hypothetical protein